MTQPDSADRPAAEMGQDVGTVERTAEAIVAALRTASRLGLDASEADVLQDSNRVVLRLKPCDVVTRVHAGADKRESLATEVSIASQLAAAGAPVGPRTIGSRPRYSARSNSS